MKTAQDLLKDVQVLEFAMKESVDSKEYAHCLESVHDEYVQEVYIILLLSVVENINQFSDTTYNQFSYINRIVKRLTSNIELQDLLQRSVMINEKDMLEYTKVLTQKDLVSVFFFDAVMEIYLYANNVEESWDYLVDLSNMFNIGISGLEEIRDIVESVINNTEKIYYPSLRVVAYNLLPSLKGAKQIFINSPDVFIYDSKIQTDANEILVHLTNVKNKKFVYLHNAVFHDIQYSISIENADNIIIEDCKFENLVDENVHEFQINGSEYHKPKKLCLINLKKIGHVLISKSQFHQIIYNLIDFREMMDVFLTSYDCNGIVAYLDDINHFCLHDSIFKDCYLRVLYAHSVFAIKVSSFEQFYNGRPAYENMGDKFLEKRYSYEEFLEYAKEDFDLERLFSGINVNNVDISNNEMIHSSQI